MSRELKPYQLIERTIIKTYRKELWNPFIRGVKNYGLINDGDRIAVCVGDSAPSMLTAKLMQQLKRVSDSEFELVFLAFSDNNDSLVDNAKRLNIPIAVTEGREEAEKKAKKLCCNKLALYDTLDSVCETLLYNMFYNSEIKTLLPSEKGGIEYIRPIYCVEEYDIEKWAALNSLSFSEEKKHGEKEEYIKSLRKKLKAQNPNVDRNILTALQGVSLDTMTGFIKDGKHYSFLDEY